tara:strand:- start:10970 stop:11350 length:381 start_codon:yes stop_codon:yes gene_type:complete
MGNRAVIQMQGVEAGIYLHWGGGADTVEPLLEVAKEYGLRGDDYGIARLAQMMGNFFGGILSIGVENVDRLDTDNGDNGTYVIDKNFNIVERLHFRSSFGEQREYDFNEMKKAIKKVNDQFFVGAR